MSVPSMFELLLSASASAAAAKAEAERSPWPMNPFPSGIRAGSATERVLAELRRVHPQHLEHGQLRFNLNASRGMITWGLRYLESQGFVERVHDPRHPHHPQATARDAWNNLCAVAGLGVHDVLIAHDPDAGTLTYRPDPGRFETREIRKDTFYRGFQRMS